MRLLLIRHAAADHLGTFLAGRRPGLHLNELGRSQASRLAETLSRAPIDAVLSSPRERAVETATPIARSHGLELTVSTEFDEVDFGAWTGQSFADLERDPDWHEWNLHRGRARAPGGESTGDVLARALTGIDRIRDDQPGRCIAVVSHCDVIRPILAHALGIPLDNLLRLEVDTASVSPIEMDAWGTRVRGVNLRPVEAWIAAFE